MLRKLTFCFLFISLLITACGGGTSPVALPGDQSLETCGDGNCSENEDSVSCASDCASEPTSMPLPTPTVEIEPLGYITFEVNVHDFVHLEDSAETLLMLIDLFDSHGVKGEFFLTGPMTHHFMEQHPEVVQRLIETQMAISYHVRPPHPAMRGFDTPLQISAINLKEQKIAEYESQRLDTTTGDLISDQPGGYQYLTQVFGEESVAVNIANDPVRGFILPYLERAGARVVVLSERGAPTFDEPFSREYNLWVRPTDMRIDRWAASGVDASLAWWTMLETDYADAYQPLVYLQDQLGSWNGERLPFVVVSISEDNFYRQGPAPWTLIYYQDESKSQPKSPPFDLSAPDLSTARSEENRVAVWDAYAELVTWASVYMDVVTSKEIVAMAEGG